MIVCFYGKVKQYTKNETIYSPAPPAHSTLRDLLGELGGYYGKPFEDFIRGNESCLFLINGKGIMLSGGLDTPIKDGDKVDILPFVEAG